VLRAPRNLAGYLFIAPAFLFLALVVAIPIFTTFELSFQELDVRTKTSEFVGWANYVKLTGSMSNKQVIIQPAICTVKGGIPSTAGVTSDFVYSPVWICR